MTSIALVLLLMISAALLAGGGARMRVLAGAAIAATLVVPFLFPTESPVLRSVAGLGAILAVLRGVELLKERPPRSAALRLWHMTAVIDTRAVRRAPGGPTLDAAGAAWL